MELASIILKGLLTIVTTLVGIGLIRFMEARAQDVEADRRQKRQEEVFEWAFKIVCTIEEEYRNSDLEKKVKSQRKFDQGISRFNDVIMVNGIDPKLYNAGGIITYAVYILHQK